MTVIELDDAQAAALQSKAARRGLTLQNWLREMANDDGSGNDTPVAPQPPQGNTGPSARPFWQMVQDVMKDVPPEVFDKLPTDGAAEHDNYLYGTPKKNL